MASLSLLQVRHLTKGQVKGNYSSRCSALPQMLSVGGRVHERFMCVHTHICVHHCSASREECDSWGWRGGGWQFHSRQSGAGVAKQGSQARIPWRLFAGQGCSAFFCRKSRKPSLFGIAIHVTVSVAIPAQSRRSQRSHSRYNPGTVPSQSAWPVAACHSPVAARAVAVSVAVSWTCWPSLIKRPLLLRWLFKNGLRIMLP